jgi:regulator of replication initiation timing
MSLENRFRVSELMSSGSRAIVSQDPVSKTHTFYADSKLVVSGSTDGGESNIPFTHIKGERDGELTGYVEKPAYVEQDLKRAVDTVVDELIAPPKPERPDVVPRPVYDALEDRFQTTLAELERANETIRQLNGQISTLQAELQATLVENDALKVQKAILDNQFQQQIERYKEMTQKVTVAIVKAAKEANNRVRLQSTVEGLIAQKDVLRQQLLSQRQLILGLTDQLDAGVAALNAQIESAAEQRKIAADVAEQQRLALENQQEQLESQLAGAAAETAAAAAGLVPFDDNQSFYGVKSDGYDTNWAGADLGWTTKQKNIPPGKAGTLTIQNLKDSGAKIVKVSVSLTGQLINPADVKYKDGPFGFSSDNGIPPKTLSVSIDKGSKINIPLYFNKKIGGENLPNPNRDRSGNKSTTYKGNFVITATYDDGTTTKSNSLSWAVRKNRG